MQQFATPTDSSPRAAFPSTDFVSRGNLALTRFGTRLFLDLPFRVGVMSFCAGFMFTYVFVEEVKVICTALLWRIAAVFCLQSAN